MAITTNLTDSTGFLWDFINGGWVNNGTDDAYDGGFRLLIDGVGHTPTFASLDEVGRELNTQPDLVGDIAVSRSEYVSATLGYARFLESFTNTSDTEQTFVARIYSNLGSDSSTQQTDIATAGPGQTIGAAFDDSVIGSGDPGTVFGWGDGVMAPAYNQLSDNVDLEFTLTLAPGETQRLLHFGAQTQSTVSGAADSVDTLLDDFTNDTTNGGDLSAYLEGLSDAELADVVNYDLSAFLTPPSPDTILTDGTGTRWTVDQYGRIFTTDSGSVTTSSHFPISNIGTGELDEGGHEINFSGDVGAGVEGSLSIYVSPDHGFVRVFASYDTAVAIAANVGFLGAGFGLNSGIINATTLFDTTLDGSITTADISAAFDDSLSGSGGTLNAVSFGWGDGTASTLDTVSFVADASNTDLDVTDGFRRYDATPTAQLFFIATNDNGLKALSDAKAFETPGPELLAGLTDDELAMIENYTLTSVDRLEVTDGDSGDNVLMGNNWGDALNGLEGNDELIGGGSDDILNGGSGFDLMIGGRGNDLYFADQTLDQAVERWMEGDDSVQSAADFQLGKNIEHLELLGTASIGVGNGRDNTIIGTSGANGLAGRFGDDTLIGKGGADTIDGGMGADSMVGGYGGDTYIVDDAGDTITELSGQGVDAVFSTISLVLNDLSAHLENLTLQGTGHINGSGNARNNSITGNSGDNLLEGRSGDDTLFGLDGNDTLNGGNGADHMVGGDGNDMYRYNNTGDTIVELAGEGIDGVEATKSLVLNDISTQVENLFLQNADNIDGGGNARDNLIIGNSGNNELSGRSGDDTLNGGLGNDTLTGGSGNDTFVFNDDWGADAINGFNPNDLEQIDLSGVHNINNFYDLINNHLSEVGGNAVISDGVNTLTLVGVSQSQIGYGKNYDPDDFIF